MKNQLNKIYIIIFVILFFTISKSYSIEDITALNDAINDARQEFNNASEASTEQSKIIDEALKEIDKATDYVQEALNNNNTQDAIKTLEFIEKSLSDVESIIPQEFGTDMSDMDISKISKEDMDIVNETTSQMNVVKEKKLNKFMSELVDLNQKGIDTVSISENLNSMGIDTIKIAINLNENKNIETWTKEEWAESYKGSILTSAGSEIVTDKEISLKVDDLEEKLQTNNLAILDKKSSLTELQTKIDPLSNQITDLQTQKTNLLAKYNEEILKQSSTVLSNEEISQSKELTDQFNNQMNEISNEIKFAEEQSSSLQQQAQGLNLELTNEIANKTQLQNNIENLSNQLSANQDILSQKTFELDRLKNTDLNTDLNTKANLLNEQLQYASRERDFIESDFEKSIDLEVDALARYHSALGDVDSKDFDKQIDFSMREVGVIMDADPRKYRAFEIEKYATYAGFSEDYIQKSIQAVNSDDWGRQKEIYEEVAKKLSKNPEWVVDVPSNAELNVMIEEEKAIQAAALASMEVDEIKLAWNTKINEQAKEFQPLAGLNTTWIKYSSLQSNTVETDLVAKELDKILNSDTELKNLTATFEEKQKQLKEIQVFQELKTQEINNAIKPLQEQVSNVYAALNDVNRTYNQKSLEKTTYINSIGGYTSLYRDKGNPNYGDWVRNIGNFDQELGDIRSNSQKIQTEALNISSEIYKIQTDNGTSQTNINNWINLQQEVGNLSIQQSRKVGAAAEQARSNIIAQVEEATAKYNEIISQENPDLKAVEEKVIKILKEVPTFADNAESLAGLDPTTLRAKLIDLTVGTNSETAALNAAIDAVAKIGKDPVGNLTGPTWEMTNIKAAAIVRSKKYDYVDDYAYITATYGDPLSLNSSQREELEGELKSFLGQDNIKLKALNSKVSELSNELNLTKEQSQNLTTEMAKLETELSSLKNSESEIQTQISDLSNQFNSKESLITEKTQNLALLQEQLNPINDRMNNLQGQRAELDTKFNDQLNTIANQIESQGQGTEEINALKTQFESQIAELDNQLKDYENQSVEINGQLTSITTELSVLETENPELANQIASLNQDLKNFINIKADLAMATAKKMGLNVDEQALRSVEMLDGKVVITIKGTELVRVVDEKMLTDQATKFIDPISELSINSKIYSSNALRPESLTQELVAGTYEVAKEAREKAVKRVNELETIGASKAEIQAAQAASDAAKYAEIAAGQSLVSNANIASASISSQQQTLEALKQVASTPGMNKWNVRRADAAIKAAEAQIAGINYDYEGAINKITNDEQKFNVWRANDYKKEIEAAKTSGNVADLKAYTRRLNNFQQRLIDERKAFEAATARTEYFDAISKVIENNTIGISNSSVQESVKAASKGSNQTNEFTTAYDSAKSAREEIDKNLNSLRQASGGTTTEAIKAAEAARSVALQAEIAAANVVASNSTAVQDAAQVAAVAAQEVAQEVAQDVAQAAQEAAQSAAEATLATLKEVASTPGMNKWDVRRANAAVKAQEAEMSGSSYDYQGAVDKINNDEQAWNKSRGN
jgi:predicted  nucleic acid-binding Zn-ribbon protein